MHSYRFGLPGSLGLQLCGKNSHTSYVWARQRPSFITRTFCECMIQVGHGRHRSSHKWRARRVSSFMLLPLSKSSCHPLFYHSQYINVVHACIHMYAFDHRDHPIPTIPCIHLVKARLCTGPGGMKVIRHAGIDSRMIILDNQACQQMTRNFQLSLQCNVLPTTGCMPDSIGQLSSAKLNTGGRACRRWQKFCNWRRPLCSKRLICHLLSCYMFAQESIAPAYGIHVLS